MSKGITILTKGITILIILIVIILTGVVLYGYNKAPGPVSSNINNVRPGDVLVEGPSIKTTPNTYNLGVVIYGEVAEHIFSVKNLGNEPLEVLRLSTSCGCTKATIADEDKVISPGQSVDMLVTFDPAVHKDDTDLGDLTRIIYIKTNDPKNPEVEVEIKAKVVKSDSVKTIEVLAESWSFSPNPIRVKKGDFIKLEISSIDVTHSFTLPSFGIDELLEPGKKVTVNFLADKIGTFGFFCSIPCGSGHSQMKGELIVE